MKRLVDEAYRKIRLQLLAMVNTDSGRHLNAQAILANEFNNMCEEIEWRDVPDDLDLTGYEVRVMNVLYVDGSLPCHLSITIDARGNRVVIIPPRWVMDALFAAQTQGQESCASLIRKKIHEDTLTHRREKIPHNNVAG